MREMNVRRIGKRSVLTLLLLVLVTSALMLAAPERAEAAVRKKSVTVTLKSWKRLSQSCVVKAENTDFYKVKIKVLKAEGYRTDTPFFFGDLDGDTSRGYLYTSMTTARLIPGKNLPISWMRGNSVLTFSLPNGLSVLKLRVTFYSDSKILNSVKKMSYEKAIMLL